MKLANTILTYLNFLNINVKNQSFHKHFNYINTAMMPMDSVNIARQCYPVLLLAANMTNNNTKFSKEVYTVMKEQISN